MIRWKIGIGNLSDLKDDLGKTDKLDFSWKVSLVSWVT